MPNEQEIIAGWLDSDSPARDHRQAGDLIALLKRRGYEINKTVEIEDIRKAYVELRDGIEPTDGLDERVRGGFSKAYQVVRIMAPKLDSAVHGLLWNRQRREMEKAGML